MSKQNVGYARVSTKLQTDGQALEQQVDRLRNAGCEKIYTDVESGKKSDRNSYRQMMADAKNGLINEVIVTRLDRLTRSLPELRKAIDHLKQHKVNLKALDDSVDVSTAAGKFHINIIGSLAEMESDRLSERTKHGWEYLRRRGVAMNPPFGYIKVNDRHQLDHIPFLCLLYTKEEKSKAAIAREIVDAYLDKRTLRLALRVINEKYGIQTFAHNPKSGGRVARDMFRFSPAGLGAWLKNPVLRGHACYLRKKDGKPQIEANWVINYDTHPEERLVTDSEFRIIEETFVQNKLVKGYGSTRQKYPLSGLVFCGECRGSCYSCAGSRGKTPGYNYYFQCKNWRTRACSQKSMIRMEDIEEAAIAQLVTRSREIAQLISQPDDIVESSKLKELRSQLAGLQSLGNNPAILAAVEEVRSQIYLEESKTTQNFQNQQILTDLLQVYENRLFFEDETVENKISLYRRLVNRIVVLNGAVIEIELLI